jgi:hypothetical protein
LTNAFATAVARCLPEAPLLAVSLHELEARLAEVDRAARAA